MAALQKAATYEVTDASLTLLDDKGKVLVKYEAVEPTALTGTEWQALAYNNGKDALQSLAADSTITALFGTDGSLAGNASVNQYTTTYTTSGEDQMTIDATDRQHDDGGPRCADGSGGRLPGRPAQDRDLLDRRRRTVAA